MTSAIGGALDVPEVPLSFAVTLSDGAVVTTEWVTV